MARRKVHESVAQRLKALPNSPGCYLLRDESGGVLYVGKAVSLRQRVRSYFQPSTRHSPRIERLVQRVRDLEWIVVDSELEALVLECNLIKEHRPPYNVRLRDDKSYPYIAITKEPYPRVIFTRNPKRGQGRCFGPYANTYAVRETLQLLHKIFPLIPCGKSWSGKDEQRPCLYYHMGQCLAPCAGLSPRAAYAEVIAGVERFLDGKQEGVVERMRAEMEQAAEQLDFEKAAAIRDRILSVQAILERQRVLSEDPEDRDVVAVVKDERGASIEMLYIRGGRLIGQRNFMLDGSQDSSPTEAVQSFLMQYYSDAPEVPREVLLPVEIEERRIVEQWLRGRRGSAVSVEVPQTGEKAKLVDLAAKNAEQALKAFALELEAKESWAEQATQQLAEELSLPMPPQRVEGFDISHIQGTAPVGSMVVFVDGQPAKSEYRRFKVRYHPESPNDFAMMHEVLTRRFKAWREGDGKFAQLPDLVMVDGGKGQLGAALRARDEQGLAVPMVGLAKRMELLFVPEPVDPSLAKTMLISDPEADYRYDPDTGHGYRYREVMLPLTAPGLMLLRRLRDEAHRFAVSFHRKIRDKRVQGSLLDEVPGVGPRRRRLLLRSFGSIEGIRRASVEEIAAVPTLTRRLAEQVSAFLRQESA